MTLAAEETPEVVQCFSTTGNGSHTLLINTKNSYTLEELLRKIQSWPGVVRTETQIILSSYKDGIKIPINQKKSSIELLKNKLIQLDDIILSCLLIVTKTTSSLLLSYLFITNRIKPIDLYKNTYLHEIWQSKKWGIVEEEKEKRESDLLIFKKIYKLIKINYEKQN